jgi:hypothetical protein
LHPHYSKNQVRWLTPEKQSKGQGTNRQGIGLKRIPVKQLMRGEKLASRLNHLIADQEILTSGS